MLSAIKNSKRNKACGIDGETVESYGVNLQEKVRSLIDAMKSKSYRPKPVRRVYIPKADKDEKRGLGIPSIEEKLVQFNLKKIIEPIYEEVFLDFSYGFRIGRSCHSAIKALNRAVMTKPINYIVEVDIKGFFDNVNHYWLQRCLEERIKDRNLLWLIRRILKAGVVEEGVTRATDIGTPQGGVISPLLANIYLHYILDIWFDRKVAPESKGHIELIRYCDDFVICCESKDDAEGFLDLLKDRLRKFGLEVSEGKTRVVKFGRRAWQQSRGSKEQVKSIDFLGFTHYCGKSRRGYFVVGHKTNKKNLSGKLKEVKEYLKRVRSYLPLKSWWPYLKSRLIGHYNYFGVSGNYRCIRQFYNNVYYMIYKWINRRSQKRSMTLEIFDRYLQYNPLPLPRYAMHYTSLKNECFTEEPYAGILHVAFCEGYHGYNTDVQLYDRKYTHGFYSTING